MPEDGEIDNRLASAPLLDDEADQRGNRDHDQREDEGRRQPVFFLSLVEHDLQGGDADREQAQAPIVDAAGAAHEIRRIEDVPLRHHEREHADWNVDVEHPAPRIVVGEPAAEHGTEDRRDDDAEAPEAHRLAAILRRKGFEQNGLRDRLQRAAGQPLEHAQDDEHRHRRREAAEERCDREACRAHHQQALASEERSEPRGHRQDDSVGREVRRQRPGRFVDRRGEIAGDVRQRHVDHGGVEHHHERARHHGARDDPGVDARSVGRGGHTTHRV